MKKGTGRVDAQLFTAGVHRALVFLSLLMFFGRIPTIRAFSCWRIQQPSSHHHCRYAFNGSISTKQRTRLFRLSSYSRRVVDNNNNNNNNNNHDNSLASGYARPVVQWYPGHIAKAERMLQETLKAVDVVVEVRDARIPKATSHPSVATWCAGRPRLLVLTHADQVPGSTRKAWRRAYAKFGADDNNNSADDDDDQNRQVQNQARQATRERLKYTPTTTIASHIPKNSQKTNNHDADAVLSPNVQDVLWVNAKMGAGIPALTRALFQAGAHVQERRQRRGLKDRPLRVGIMGYPNVGKSALINRLLGRKRAKSSNTPGITRSLQWIRVRTDHHDTATHTRSTRGGNNNRSSSTNNNKKRKELELLDSPGIIPASLVDQSDATLLAACNCIGNAAYDNQAVAAYLCEWLIRMHRSDDLGYGATWAPDWRRQCQERYGYDPMTKMGDGGKKNNNDNGAATATMATGEDMLFAVADATCQGDPEDAARKILQDFRTGRMGLICLQVAPVTADDKGQRAVVEGSDVARQRQEAAFVEEQRERARLALETARKRGLELPPVLLEKQRQQQESSGSSDAKSNDDEVGKGLFEGW